MKILVTSARMPFALAVDPQARARPATRSTPRTPTRRRRAATRATSRGTWSPPRRRRHRAVRRAGGRVLRRARLDLIVPDLEEVFYLPPRASGGAGGRLYAPQFETLARVHDKHSFERLVEQLGIRAPVGVTVRSDEELHEAVERWPHYFGRGVFSRGGVTLLTNTGPAGRPGWGRGRPPDPRPAVARAGVRRRADGVHLLHAARGRVTAHCIPRAAPVPPLDRHPVRVDRRQRVAGGRRTGRGARLHRPDVARLRGRRGRAGHHRVQPAPHRRHAADGGRGAGRRHHRPVRELEMVPPGPQTQLDFAVLGGMFDDGLKGVPGPSTTWSRCVARTAAGTTSCPTCTRSWPSATTSG